MFANFLTGGIGDIISGIGNIADDLITTKEEKLQLALKDKALNIENRKLDLEDKRIDNENIQGQIDLNKIEANHKSVFVAGWRPFLGWIGAFSLGYKFILHPIMIWFWFLLQAKNIIPKDFATPPAINASELYPIILGLLGIGGMRSFDKLKGSDTSSIISKKTK